MKLAEHQRIVLWTLWGRSGFQDRFLVYAGRAPCRSASMVKPTRHFAACAAARVKSGEWSSTHSRSI